MPIDYKNYHPKWTLIVRMIKRREGHQCKWCGAKNYLPHPVTGSMVILTIAHIDQVRTNNRFNNLAALCQRCHLNHDRKQHLFNRKYGRETKYKNGKLFFWAVLQSCYNARFQSLSSRRVTKYNAPSPIFDGKEGEQTGFPFSATAKRCFTMFPFLMLQQYKITIKWAQSLVHQLFTLVTLKVKKGLGVTLVLQPCYNRVTLVLHLCYRDKQLIYKRLKGVYPVL